MANKLAVFKVEATTLEPFRIGAIQDPMSGIDNPVASVGKRPVIQGPSLKGALRAEIEQHLILQYSGTPEMMPCIPSSVNALSAEERQLIQAKKFRDDGACVYSDKQKSSSICPACYFLGAQGLVGFTRVPYLYCDTAPETLYSVRIDRATGVVRERTNRDYQLLPDGTTFTGKMELLLFDPTRNWELGRPRPQLTGLDNWLSVRNWAQQDLLNEFIVQRLEAIRIIGGFKSKGFGRVKIMVTPLH
ncbi:MAG: hypothetical protein IBX68_08840 [Dehalococcoidia bacterium]|nr:hypothetical protein [Dehalococcoidia bacterium]